MMRKSRNGEAEGGEIKLEANKELFPPLSALILDSGVRFTRLFG
jgi:hypothetical protein